MNKHLLSLSIAAALLTGCGSDSDSSSSSQPNNSDTTSYTTVSGVDGSAAYAYFDFETGKVLTLTDEEAKTNTDWDIAFYGLNVALNGGYSGPGDVSAYFTGNNADFYDAEGKAVKDKFINATSESELVDFEEITSADIPDLAEFETDEFTTVIKDYYNYDYITHVVTANTENYFLVKTTSGYSKLRVNDLMTEGRVLTKITLGSQYKGVDDQTFAVENNIEVDMAECTADTYVDLDTESVVEATESWELKFTCTTDSFSNIGASYEYLLGDNTTGYALKSDSDVSLIMEHPQYYLTGDYAETVFKHKNKWYQYGINGENKVWSQYGVYLVNTGDTTYKFQITSYYTVGDDGTVAGRNYGFRYEALPEAASAE